MPHGATRVLSAVSGEPMIDPRARDLPHGVVEGGSGHLVALVDNQQTAVAGPSDDVVVPAQGWRSVPAARGDPDAHGLVSEGDTCMRTRLRPGS